ncbi:MAG: RNA polymerase sigma factor region1.1 domain-containing protein, partial [Chloroflexota bacterium]|nr:RNA polymerase sigma factor region1.1 domain-containing protein [Chloroflexota bacterium]
MTVKKKPPPTRKHLPKVIGKKPSQVLELATSLAGRADAAWARAADLPDQDAALDALVQKAGSRKRLTLEQVRTVFPEIEQDPDQIADLRQLLGEMRIRILNNGAAPPREKEEEPEAEVGEELDARATVEL